MSTSKVWFITGASRGFGLEITRDALQRGDSVVGTARNPQAIIDAIGEHPNLLAVKLEVTNEEEAQQAVAAAVEKFGRIDVLVNNAGYGLLGAVEESSGEEVQAIFNVKVFGWWNVVRAALPYLRQQRSGHILNFSSIGGYSSHLGWGVYGATKFAVEGISEALSDELRPLGIHSTVVEPGFFRTDFLSSNSLVSTKARIADYDETVGKVREFAAAADHKQPGDPKKFSRAILSLVDSSTPPVRLPLGSDTVARIRSKNQFVETEMSQWLDLALSTDHDDVRKG